MKTCPKCNGSHNKAGKFCSRSCANSRVWSQSDKDKIRKGVTSSEKFKVSMSDFLLNSELQRTQKTCPICTNVFSVSPSLTDKIYCSKACYLHDHNCTHRSKSSGGYRQGSGRAKTGHYKGIYCGSTYELAWVIYHLDHNIFFERFNGLLEHNNVKYYPDFLIENTIIEIKGYESQHSVDKKTQVAEHHGFNVKVLRKENLQKEFEWVKNNYQYNKLYELYDDYKPSYTLVCNECGVNFSRNKKSKTKRVFCNRYCAGKGRHKLL